MDDVQRALERAERVLIGWDWNSSPESVARAAVLAFLKDMSASSVFHVSITGQPIEREWKLSTLAAAIEEAQG